MRLKAWPAALVAIVGLAACEGMGLPDPLAGYQRTAQTWIGAQPAELHAAWGDWQGTRALDLGTRQIVYSQSRELAGTDVGCEVRFTVSAEGVVVRAQVSGTIGSCRQMLRDAPARRGSKRQPRESRVPPPRRRMPPASTP